MLLDFIILDQNLSTDQNRKIYEGAILYIREGIEYLRVGEAFDFDNVTYPTPLP